jgi:hypothetical protein
MIFLQKTDRPFDKPLMWQAGSHVFCKSLTDRLINLYCGRRGAMIFLQKPYRPLAKPFLWRAGSQDIFAKICKSHHKNCQTDPLNCFCSCISSFSFPVLNQVFCKILLYSTVFSNLWRKFHKYYSYFLKGKILLVKYAKTNFFSPICDA